MLEIKINGTIAAVDGGLLAQEMHGTDLIIARATAVIFNYLNLELVSHEYFPNAFPEADYEIRIGLDEREIMSFRSPFKLKKEIIDLHSSDSVFLNYLLKENERTFALIEHMHIPQFLLKQV